MSFQNPFDENESSMERGNPVTQGAKNAAKGTQAYVQQQKQDTKKEIDQEMVDFLYGNTLDPSENEKKGSTDVVTKILGQVQATSNEPAAHGSEEAKMQQEIAGGGGDDASKLADARERLASLNNTQAQGRSGLFKQHMPENLKKLDYEEETFGENARRRREQEAKQKEEEEQQQEEEQKQQEEEEKEQKDQELEDMFAGPKEKGGPGGKSGQKGRNKMQAPPLAMKRAQTKAEASRGTVG